MNKQPEQSLTGGNDLFDEIDIDPISEIREEPPPAAADEETEEGVQWVVKVDDNRAAQVEPSATPTTRELMEAEAHIPTRKLKNQSIGTSPVPTDKRPPSKEPIDQKLDLEKQFKNSILGEKRPAQDKDAEDVEDIKRMLEALEKSGQMEEKITPRPAPPVPGKPKVSEDTGAVNIQQLLAELSDLEQKENTRPSKPLTSEKPKARETKAKSTQRLVLPEIDSLVQKESNKTTGSAPSAEGPKPAQSPESSAPEDVHKLLAELDEVENKEAVKPTRPLFAPAKPKQTAPLNADDNSDLKRTLAEMSFLEGNESIAQGDRAGAIAHYRDAINYNPDSADYYIKLGEVLSQESATKTEADQLLQKAIELVPSNMELRSKLAELRGETTPAVKKGTQNLAAGAAAGAQGKTGRLSRARFISADAIKLPQKISFGNLFILGIFFVALLWGVSYSMRSGPVKSQIKPLIPPDEASVTQDQIALEWQGIGDRFKIQIEENGKPVMERTTVETRYNLLPEDLSLLKADRRYTWRAIPLNLQGEPTPYITDDFHFKVVASAKAASSASQEIKKVEFSTRPSTRRKKAATRKR